MRDWTARRIFGQYRNQLPCWSNFSSTLLTSNQVGQNCALYSGSLQFFIQNTQNYTPQNFLVLHLREKRSIQSKEIEMATALHPQQQKSELTDNEHECFVLYASPTSNARIVLHRNMRQQFEYVLISQSLVPESLSGEFFIKNFFMMNEYAVLLHFQLEIVDYLSQCEQQQHLFECFFNMSIDAFFRTIDTHSK